MTGTDVARSAAHTFLNAIQCVYGECYARPALDADGLIAAHGVLAGDTSTDSFTPPRTGWI
jgi:hypothetical protein